MEFEWLAITDPSEWDAIPFEPATSTLNSDKYGFVRLRQGSGSNTLTVVQLSGLGRGSLITHTSFREVAPIRFLVAHPLPLEFGSCRDARLCGMLVLAI